MAGGTEKTINLRFKMTDDGSIVLDKVTGKMAQMPKHVESMNTSLNLIKWDSLVSLGKQALETGQQIMQMARETASAINDIERSARVAGMATDEYQKMAYAAKMSDVSIEELSVGMKRFSVNMDEAQKVGGPAADKFERIGVSIKDSSGKMKELNQIMLEIADKFSTWEDGPRKIAIAVDLFGRSGERLIPYLNQGAEGIKRFYEEAEKMGIILDKDLIAKGTELEDQFKRAEARFSAFAKTIVVRAYEMVDSIESAAKAQEHLNEAIKSAGGIVTEEDELALEMQKVNEAAEHGAKIFEKLNAAALKQAMQPPAMVDKEKDLKIYREVNLQLLKDEESTLKRMIDLQEKLNKSSDDAIKIMEQLGVGTKASLTQWIEQDIVGEYSKLLGSKLFNPDELEAAKGKYIEALRSAMSTGGWGGEFRQIEEAINRINTMKVEDTELQKARDELRDLQKYMEYLNTFTATIKLDDEQLVTAKNQITELRRQLIELTSQRWDLNIAITGTGSTEKPIMDKIDEIWGGFENMQDYIANMKAEIEMSNITAQIKQYEEAIVAANAMGHVPGSYIENYFRSFIPQYQQTINSLEEQKRLLAGAQGAYGAPATASPTGGGGIGEVSININTINVIAGMESVAEELDDQLADLWAKNRSKLKVEAQKG